MTEKLIDRWDCDVESYLILSSFWGRTKNRRCVQLTVNRGPDASYAQMTYDDARLFFKLAIEEIDKIEKRYNENAPWWEEIHDSSVSTKIEGEE